MARDNVHDNIRVTACDNSRAMARDNVHDNIRAMACDNVHDNARDVGRASI